MKLYFSPGACSLSPHIALREAGLDFEIERVDLTSKKTRSGDDFTTINPKGYVPALRLDDGEILTEGPAILQYVADKVPERKLAAPAGSFERYRLQETLNFISTELHKGFSPLFNPAMPDEAKTIAKTKLADRFKWLDSKLEGHQYLMGDTFSVADAYLFTTANWSKHVGLDISGLANLGAFMGRVAARPAVQAAMRAEGLIK